jgi:hypothetical protein
VNLSQSVPMVKHTSIEETRSYMGFDTWGGESSYRRYVVNRNAVNKTITHSIVVSHGSPQRNEIHATAGLQAGHADRKRVLC